MDKSILATLAAVALALPLTACQPTVDRVDPAQRRAMPNLIDDERVSSQRGLRRDLWVVELREATVGGDMLKVEAELENLRHRAESYNYAFEWFDAEGMRLREPQWRTIRLQGNQRGSISAVANTAEAVDFRLHLQGSRN